MGASMAKITLDYNFAASANVQGGIASEDLEALLDKARSGFAKLSDMVKDNRAGFPLLPYQSTDAIKALAKEVYGKYNDLVVIGIGSSSLSIEAIADALLPQGYNNLSFVDRRSFPKLWVLDNADPAKAGSVMRYCKPEDTFVVVISKSGQTIETAANFILIMDWLKKANVDMKKHVVAVTNPVKGTLNTYAKENNIGIFPLEYNVATCYTVLSPVGLLPAALLGIDIDQLLTGAKAVLESESQPFLTLAALYMHFMKTRNINVLMPYTSRLVKFTEWYVQLWGENLGQLKGDGHMGTTPVRACGAVDQHSQLQLYLDGPQDKLVTFVGVAKHDMECTLPSDIDPAYDYLAGQKLGEILNMELKATEAIMLGKQRPSLRIDMPSINEATLGELFMLWEYTVAIIGLAEDISPFEQPAVELGKHFVYGMIGKDGFEQKKEQLEKVYVKSPEFIIK
jgi:glucose-6-phosphate isomerase